MPAGVHLLALVLLLLLSALPGCEQQGESGAAASRAEIRQAWESIAAGYTSRNPRAVTTKFTASSWPYYERIRVAAVSGTREQIAAMPAMERALVVTARHRVAAADLQSLDGLTFLQLAIRDGWFDFDDPFQIEFINVNITPDGTQARARLEIDSERTDYWFHFIREDDSGQPSTTGVWKLDDPASDETWNDLIAMSAHWEGMTEDELLIRDEEETSGRPVRRDIWDRPTIRSDLPSTGG